MSAGVIDNTFNSGYIDRAMEKQLLASNRNFAYKGIGIGYVHVLFAKMFENDSTYLCGRAVTYRDSDWENKGGSICAYYGSGDLSVKRLMLLNGFLKNYGAELDL